MPGIFGYADGEDDELRVETRETGDFLAFRIPPDTANEVDGRGVNIPRDAVLRLHAALGEWLYPVHTPEGPNRSLIEQMIDKAVKDQVAAVLPLHLAPFATQMQAAEDKIGRVANALMSDPEPGDVGHPRPATEPDPLFAPGAREYYQKALGLSPEPEPQHGRLMAELPRRIRQLPEPGCVCGHGWMEHYSSMCWGGEEKYGCRCTQVRPAPVPVQEYCGRCTHSWARHGVGAGNCNVRIPGGECGCEEMHP